MIDILNNIKEKVTTTFQKKKSVDDLIEEIHESFYTEVDRLLADARISRSLETDKQDLIDKATRLRNLGFKNTKEVIEAQQEIDRLRELESTNKMNQDLVNAIEYFSARYFNYKFITEDSVKKICAKYNLVYGTIDKYIGTVPDKNLKHIEDFKIKEEDVCYNEINNDRWNRRVTKYEVRSKQYVDKEIKMGRADLYGSDHSFEKCPLEIVAPLKDFNMKAHEVKDFKISKIEIPDPVVLQPVIYNDQKHYLIVTAWGIEASDELVVNFNHN